MHIMNRIKIIDIDTYALSMAITNKPLKFSKHFSKKIGIVDIIKKEFLTSSDFCNPKISWRNGFANGKSSKFPFEIIGIDAS